MHPRLHPESKRARKPPGHENDAPHLEGRSRNPPPQSKRRHQNEDSGGNRHLAEGDLCRRSAGREPAQPDDLEGKRDCRQYLQRIPERQPVGARQSEHRRADQAAQRAHDGHAGDRGSIQGSIQDGREYDVKSRQQSRVCRGRSFEPRGLKEIPSREWNSNQQPQSEVARREAAQRKRRHEQNREHESKGQERRKGIRRHGILHNEKGPAPDGAHGKEGRGRNEGPN